MPWFCFGARRGQGIQEEKIESRLAQHVFLAMDLMRAIGQFQDGIYSEERCVLFGGHLVIGDLFVKEEEFHQVDRALDPWYKLRGLSRLEILLCEAYQPLVRVVFLHAVYFGNVGVLEYLHPFIHVCPKQAPHWTPSNGRLQIVHNYDLIDLAASNGHVNVLEFLHRNNYQETSPSAIQRAVIHGHYGVVQYLFAQNLGTCTSRLMDIAAERGFLNIVQLLHDQPSVKCSKNAVDYAAANGHTLVVQWLLENRLEGCSKKALATARANGHFNIVQFLLQREKCHQGYVEMNDYK